MAGPAIESAYSAQPSIARPNPLLAKALDEMDLLLPKGQAQRRLLGADQGCGKLRHLHVIAPHFARLHLVDTDFQLTRRQRLFGVTGTSVAEYCSALSLNGTETVPMTSVEFARRRLGLDAIISVCVFSAVEPSVRQELIASALRNLVLGGLYLVIVPRNDQSVLRRCTVANRHLDGHVFDGRGVRTFFKHHRHTDDLLVPLVNEGFEPLADLSTYRHLCVIVGKAAKRRRRLVEVQQYGST